MGAECRGERQLLGEGGNMVKCVGVCSGDDGHGRSRVAQRAFVAWLWCRKDEAAGEVVQCDEKG